MLVLVILYACSDKNTGVTPTGNTNQPAGQNKVFDTGWSVPIDQVRDGGVGKDGIISIENPQFTPSTEVEFMKDDDLVILVSYDGIFKVYPIKILDYHEVVNDNFNEHLVTVSHCPLTGTSVAWAGLANGLKTGYGVSGLLFNNNLIMYDRETDGYWSQMMSQSIFGENVCSFSANLPIVETSWSTFKLLGVPALVMNTNVNGFNRNYDDYPYGNYKTDNDYILFPVAEADDVIESKQRVHLIINRIDDQQFTTVIPLRNTFFTENDGVIIIGNEELNFVVSYIAKAEDGTPLSFMANFDDLSSLLEDGEGTKWNLMGKAMSGPRKGEQLKPTQSMMSYWFPITSIFNSPLILNLHPAGG